MKVSVVLVRVLLLCSLLLSNILYVSGANPGVVQASAAGAAPSLSLNQTPTSAVDKDPVTVTPLAEPSSLNVAASDAREFTAFFLASKDTFVDSATPTTNYGNASSLMVYLGPLPNSDRARTLLHFNVTGLPENAVVLTATLELHSVVNLTLALDEEITIYPDSIDSDWSETAVTWNTRPASTYRGDGPAERVPNGWTQWDVTNMVNGWISGAYPNHGIHLRTGNQGTAEFQTRNMDDSPRLTVIYTTEGSPMQFPAQKDAWINEVLPSTNYGNDTHLTLSTPTGNRAYALVGFDTSDLPSNINVLSATLEMYSQFNIAQAALLWGESIFPDAIHADWDEMTVTWNTRPIAYGEGDPTTAYQPGWLTWDVTHIVQGWVSGSFLNYGIELRMYSTEAASYNFFARSSLQAPRLSVYYEPAPPVCEPVTTVRISGLTQGSTGVDYAFEAQAGPLDTTSPITYTWTATDKKSVMVVTSATTDRVTFNWATAGTKIVSVTAENCGGMASDSHQVDIAAPPPTCPVPLTDLTFSGPTQGMVGTGYTFSVLARPKAVTTPVTFTWQADGQSPVTVSGTALQSSQVYTWGTLGPKAITVTAANCGSAFVRFHTMDIVEPSALPDVVVTTAWYDSEHQQIGYLVKNNGGSTAPAGHFVSLDQGASVPGETMAFPHALQSGAIREAYFDTARTCTAGSEPIRICADTTDTVAEGDETNNCWELTWPCDMDAPVITSGPTVVGTTENTATISWQTDEPCSSEVHYGKSSSTYPDSHDSSAYVTHHEAVVSHLEAMSVYHFYVLVTDMGGTSVNNDEAFFETAALGTDAPVITYLHTVAYPDPSYELYAIQTSVDAIAGLDRIEFTYDGALIKTETFYPGHGLNAYAIISPYALGETRASFFGSGHLITVKAINLNGRFTTESMTFSPPATERPVELEMVSPAHDMTLAVIRNPAPVGTEIEVRVNAVEFGWGCTYSESSLGVPAGVEPIDCDAVDREVDEILLQVDGVPFGTYTPTSGEFGHTFLIDLSGAEMGARVVKAIAHISDGSTRSVQRTVTLVVGTPGLSLERTVTRIDNVFEVQLTLVNAADATLDVSVLRV
ncbi:MAG: DNRLRE domain-containing protein, partial [Anaerolineae bacterium]|nr:DNRLRE domain-containing protein [Anaerolineae bacterium]